MSAFAAMFLLGLGILGAGLLIRRRDPEIASGMIVVGSVLPLVGGAPFLIPIAVRAASELMSQPALLAMLFVGAALALFGWRRRVTDSHVVCNSCDYDLEGLDPLPSSCPECGVSLVAAGATRIGNGYRRMGFVYAGLSACAAVLGVCVQFLRNSILCR